MRKRVGVLNPTPSLAVKTLRSRGAAAAHSSSHARAASAAALSRTRATSASKRSVESSFPRRERRSHVRPYRLESLRSCGNRVGRAGVQVSGRRCAAVAVASHGAQQLRQVPSPLFGIGRGVESIAGQSSRGRGGSVAGAHNTRLQRTVRRQHVRAASAALPLCARGAHETSARRRSTARYVA
jgi:hypothetical protein